MSFPPNLRIAQSASLKPLGDIAEGMGIGTHLMEPYGEHVAKIKLSAIDFSNELLSAFFGTGDEPASHGLAAALSATMPYWRNETSQPFFLDDATTEWLVVHIGKWISLPTQRNVLRSASNHELLRARRVLVVAFGLFGRPARSLRETNAKRSKNMDALRSLPLAGLCCSPWLPS